MRVVSNRRMASLWCVVLVFALPTPAPAAESFSVLLKAGDPLPGGGTVARGFFPTAVNAQGEAVFGAFIANDAGRVIGEGTFLLGRDGLVLLARPGLAAPGGGTFSRLGVETMDINEARDASFTYTLEPFRGSPFGLNAGAYRYANGSTSPVVLPGERFAGAAGTAINDHGDIDFGGIFETESGPDPDLGLGIGLFVAGRSGEVTPLVLPGDAAPGGGTFETAEFPRFSNGGDVAFMAHEAGDECGSDADGDISCLFTSVYVFRAAGRRVEPVAVQGAPAPDGSPLRAVVGPRINDQGDVLYVAYWGPGGPIPPHSGLFLHSNRTTRALVLPGDRMPGGGRVIRVRGAPPINGINDAGQAGFIAVVRLDDGTGEQRLYRWSRHGIELVARPGTEVPGGIVIDFVDFGGQIDARGRILFSAYDKDDKPLLVRASPVAGD